MTDITSVTHPMIHIAPKDLSVDFMSAIFGPVVDAIRNSGSAGGAQFTAATAGDSLLGSMMQVMNETMLFLAALYIVYIVITHSLRLGEEPTGTGGTQIRGSSLWTPVRIPLAVSALLPYAGGYSFLQLLVLWLALNSVGAADALNTVFMKRLPQQVGQMQMDPRVRGDVQQVVESLLRMSSCAASYNHAVNRSLKDLPWKDREKQMMTIYPVESSPNPVQQQRGLLEQARVVFRGEKKITPGPGVVWRAGVKNGPPDLRDACGSIRLSSAVVHGPRPDVGGWIDHLLRGDTTERESAVLREIYAAQRAAFRTVLHEIVATTRNAVWKDQPYPRNFIRHEVELYQEIVQSRAGSALGLAGDSRALVQGRGWVAAGGYLLPAIERQQQIRAALADLPELSQSTSSQDWQTIYRRLGGGHVAQAMHPHIERVDAIIRAARQPTPDPVQQPEAGRVVWKIIESLTGSGSAEGGDPLLRLSAAGRQILDSSAALAAGWSLSVAGIAAAGGAAEVAAGKGIAGRLRALGRSVGGGLLTPITAGIAFLGTWMPLLIAGALLAYLAPLLPVIVWIVAVAGWFVLLVESVIASVVWAVSWLRPEVDTPVGHGRTGWMLILSVMLRPSLMLCGLAAAILASSMGLRLVESVLGPAVAALAGPGGAIHAVSEIIGTIVLLLVWAGLAVSVVLASYQLVHIVPDRILKWLGEGVDMVSDRLDHTRTLVVSGMHQGGYGIAGAARGGARRMLPRG